MPCLSLGGGNETARQNRRQSSKTRRPQDAYGTTSRFVRCRPGNRGRATHPRAWTKRSEQQTATSEVLKVISSSPGELEAVFQDLAGECNATFARPLSAQCCSYEGDVFRRVALHNAPPAFTGIS
mgnify:CR=1 FL=1